MKRVLLLLFLCLAISLGSVQCQTVFPDGIYFTLDQLKGKQPERAGTLGLGHYYPDDFPGGRVNQYKLESDSLNNRQLTKKILAYIEDGEMYINAWRFDRYLGFSKCLTKGNFLVFWSVTRPDETGAGWVAAAGILGGAIGGAIAGSVVEQNAEPAEQALYILSLRTGNVRLFTKDYLLARLEDRPSLWSQYVEMPLEEQNERMLDYVHILNEVTPIE